MLLFRYDIRSPHPGVMHPIGNADVYGSYNRALTPVSKVLKNTSKKKKARDPKKRYINVRFPGLNKKCSLLLEVGTPLTNRR